MTVANPLRAENLRSFRLVRRLSQTEMVEKCRFTGQQVLSGMEGGTLPISIKTVDRIAAAFDMSAAAVLAELDSVAPREPIPVPPTRRDAELAALALGGNAQEKLRRFGATLAGRELEIFRDRIIADNPVTLKALGDRWNVCRERVRQLEKMIVTRLRDHNLLENP